MTEEANERLIQFLNDGRNWERKATNKAAEPVNMLTSSIS
jgi:hypothetical protein